MNEHVTQASDLAPNVKLHSQFLAQVEMSVSRQQESRAVTARQADEDAIELCRVSDVEFGEVRVHVYLERSLLDGRLSCTGWDRRLQFYFPSPRPESEGLAGRHGTSTLVIWQPVGLAQEMGKRPLETHRHVQRPRRHESYACC